MTQNPGSGTAGCLKCGARFAADGRFCPVCGEPLDAPAAPIEQPTAPAPANFQPQGHGPVPGNRAVYGSPPPARRNRTPIFVGLGFLGLILVIAAGVLLVPAAASGHATPSPSAVALATPTAAPASPSPSRLPTSKLSTPTKVPIGTIVPTGSMTEARFGSTATLLPNGKVLIVGGSDSGFHATAELYDPKTGTFSPTGSMYYQVARGFATATLLANGLVLVAGGSVNGLAELYDPATGTFSPTDPMGANRADATATMLRDGRVLMAGGIDRCDGPSCSPFYTAELYDPKTGTFSPTGSMKAARYNATATLLLDGRVLVAGGNVGDTDKPKPVADAEVYDPATGKFTPTGSMAVARSDAGAVLLHDGQVLIAGGDGESTSAELYDPATGTFRTTGEMFHSHGDANATMLLDGRVLVDGGATVAEVYDPSSGEFTQIDSEVILRIGTTATPLQDGRVLIAGGWDGKTRYSSAELYVP